MKVVPITLLILSFGIFFWYINPAYKAISPDVPIEKKSVKELQSLNKKYSEAVEKAQDLGAKKNELRFC